MKLLYTGVLVGVFALAPLTALAQPSLPNQFYGTVAYDSGTTPAGLAVRALSGTTVIATSVTQTGGRYGIMPDLLIVADQDNGAAILFTVNGTPARETASFVSGKLTNLNLTVPGAVPGGPSNTSEGTQTTQTTQTSGGGGGGGGSITTTAPATTQTVTATLTEAQKTFDTNTDNKIDVLDFNALIVHWGETGSNVVADFDGNGQVDVFDFNALMVHWTA